MRGADKRARTGGSLVLAWGPPWNWRPSFERSRYYAGWSLCWLGLGLYYCQMPVEKLLLDGAYPRCAGCQRPLRPEDERLPVGERPYCGACWARAVAR